MGARARTVLRLIGELEEEGVAPTVGDVVIGGTGGSAPTAYATLDELQKAGWIERVTDKEDSRARRVQLTPKARKTFDRMSRRFLSAFSGSSD